MKSSQFLMTLIGGLLLSSASLACVPQGSANRANQDFERFINQNANLMRPGEVDIIAGMYEDIITFLRRSEGNCSAPTPQAVAETNARFGHFYENVGVGGQVLFNSFRPPFQENPWEGGRWVGWFPSTSR
jgi:hypothetical protein